MSKNRNESSITETIMLIIDKEKPQSVRHLVDLVKENSSVPEHIIIENIIRLQSQGRIVLRDPGKAIPKKLGQYLRTRQAYWYWITLALSTATTIAVLTVPRIVSPAFYLRQALGALFVLFLPGYTFVKALFPDEPLLKTASRSLDYLERFALSVGISITLVPILGLLLNFTPLGLGEISITVSLMILVTALATISVAREHQLQLSIISKVLK